MLPAKEINANASAPLLELTGVRIARVAADCIFELHVDDFRFSRGQFIAVVGESGCGKSTLLDVLGLVLQPARADTFVLRVPDGREVDLRTASSRERTALRRQYLGYVLQSGGLLDFLSLGENIALPLQLNGGAQVRQRVRRMAEELGIGAQLRKKPAPLSGGQRQRGAIARALIHEPVLVLADEPTAALDRPRARSLVALFRRCCSENGAALVMVTHDLALVQGLADRVYTFSVVEKDNGSQVTSHCFAAFPHESPADAATASE